MRKVITLSVTLILIGTVTLAQKSMFRETTWGMTKSEVKANESRRLLQEKPRSLYYMDTVNDHKMYVLYKFEGPSNGLNEGQYILNEDPGDVDQYISMFENFKSRYTQRFGEPTIDTTLVQSEEYYNKPTKYKEGLQSGQVRFQTSWVLENTEVVMQLWNSGKQMRFAIQFVGKNL